MYLLLLFPLLFWLSGSSAAQTDITGPKTVSGLERGSLTVCCKYASKWKTYKKWWCRGAEWSSCRILVITNGSEQEVKKERLSIRDHQKDLVFNVTLEDLRRDDADTYWCGIERTGADVGYKVKVTIGPAPTTVPTMVPTTSVSTMNTFTVPVTTEKTRSFSTPSSYLSSGRYGITNLSILLPLIFAVLLLLLVAASLLAWWMVKRQKKALPKPGSLLCVTLLFREALFARRSRAAALSSEQPVDGELCYANLSLNQPGTSLDSSRKEAPIKSSSAQANQGEVEYVTMAPFPREEISYASLCLDILDQEPTYSNTGRVPRRSHVESTEYVSFKKP